jgi:hypothetical protein
MVAALSIYLGYCGLGVITTDTTGWMSPVFGRPATLVEGALLLAAGLVLTRPVAGGHGTGRTAVVSSGAVMLLAAVAVMTFGGRTASDVWGVADLIFATASILTVVAAERDRRGPVGHLGRDSLRIR